MSPAMTRYDGAAKLLSFLQTHPRVAGRVDTQDSDSRAGVVDAQARVDAHPSLSGVVQGGLVSWATPATRDVRAPLRGRRNRVR
jgi:hypothetical protein